MPPQLEKGAWMMKDGIVLVLPYVLTRFDFYASVDCAEFSVSLYVPGLFLFCISDCCFADLNGLISLCCGKRAIYLQLLAMAAANGILIYKNGISVSGFGPFLQDYFNLLLLLAVKLQI